MEALLNELKEKKPIEFFTEKIYKEPDLIPTFLDIMRNEKSAAKYHAEKVIRMVSQEKPELLYPYFDEIVSFLESSNNIIKLGVILIIPNLLALDSKKKCKWESMREKYILFYNSKHIPEFGNAVKSFDKIYAAYPKEEDSIIPILLGIEKREFIHHGEVSPDCLNVAIGKIIECFTWFYPKSKYKTDIKNFIINNRNNERKQVRTLIKKSGIA